MVYRFKNGTYIKGVSAQVVGEVCADLESDGNLTPRALVDVSRPEDAPLHGQFEWNDTKAAEKYRETQAQYIIRHIEVVPESTKTPTRAFVSIEVAPEKSEHGKSEHFYHSITEVMSDVDMRQQLLSQAFVDFAVYRRKYSSLTELANVFAAFDRLVA